MPPEAGLTEVVAGALGVSTTEAAAALRGHGGTGVVHVDARAAFLKCLPRDEGEALAAEADGLAALAGTPGLRVPAVLACAEAGGRAFLLTEYIALRPARGAASAALGEAVAALHARCGERHGWHRDNFIGATPQPNTPDTHWARFYREQRLRPQWQRARQNGAGAALLRAVEQVMERLPARLEGHQPAPSLLHGDLWAGNAAADAQGRPVLYDPAVHYGDRECDLAMAALFGGFDADFSAAYEAAWPLPEGHRQRRPLYQLYHLLNHFNLFGGAYEASARRAAEAFLAD
ncbi:fructosamine kinase family protein [Spiribacter halobius]|uniref:Fructosamine kinase family protein n=1 Tax=Sediminicurvatus halobius TaxID=2182432 RepID=A0A2U2N7C0_9GAMM|nr:fructosamine kinase family protein [Spiribacter halobius]PWG64849.1 hypothetical protein DEM34_03370 [Spiribacter halobius]UEX78298.1 fructosamine kinase family protein [Spiribacter halobius]